jgi:hypothetical protein
MIKETVDAPLAWRAFGKGVVNVIDESLDCTIVTDCMMFTGHQSRRPRFVEAGSCCHF